MGGEDEDHKLEHARRGSDDTSLTAPYTGSSTCTDKVPCLQFLVHPHPRKVQVILTRLILDTMTGHRTFPFPVQSRGMAATVGRRSTFLYDARCDGQQHDNRSCTNSPFASVQRRRHVDRAIHSAPEGICVYGHRQAAYASQIYSPDVLDLTPVDLPVLTMYATPSSGLDFLLKS